MLGIAILLGFNLLGLLLHYVLHIPLPANVIGLILFVICLFLKLIKLEWVEDAAQFMIKHMMIFFAPIIVGTMVFFPLLGEYWISISFTIVLSTIVVLLVTGWSTSLLINKSDTKEGMNKHE